MDAPRWMATAEQSHQSRELAVLEDVAM